MNDMMGLGLMGLLGNGGGFGMDQVGIGPSMNDALAGNMPPVGIAGLFGGMGGMPMGGMNAMGGMMGAQSILGMFLQRKQQEEMMKQRKEMFDKYLEMMKQRGARQAPLQRPVAPQKQFPLYTF